MNFFDHAGRFVAEQVAPAVQGTVNHIAEHAGPAVQGTMNHIVEHAGLAVQQTLDDVGQHAGPVVRNAVNMVSESVGGAVAHTNEHIVPHIKDVILPNTVSFSSAIGASLVAETSTLRHQIQTSLGLGYLTGKMAEMAAELMEKLHETAAGPVLDWVYENQRTSASIAAALALLISLSPAAGLAVNMAGFGPLGVNPETLASFLHSKTGNVASGSIFATLQSAGAGGAGLQALKAMLMVATGMGLAVGVAGVVVLIASEGKTAHLKAE